MPTISSDAIADATGLDFTDEEQERFSAEANKHSLRAFHPERGEIKDPEPLDQLLGLALTDRATANYLVCQPRDFIPKDYHPLLDAMRYQLDKTFGVSSHELTRYVQAVDVQRAVEPQGSQRADRPIQSVPTQRL